MDKKNEEIDKDWLMLNLKSPEADGEFERMLSCISVSENEEGKRKTKENLRILFDYERKMARQKRWGIAASVAALLAMTAGILLLISNNSLKSQLADTPSWTEITTAYGESRSVTLPDGSTLWLNNDSRLLYPDRFNDAQRQVFASGEIFADIRSDASCPFLICGNGSTTRVTGTRFNWRSYPDMECVEISLISGKVSLETKTSGKDLRLDIRPGEIVKVNFDAGSVTRRDLTEEYVNWKEKRVLFFNDMTLEQIANELRRQFSVEVVLGRDALRSQRYYASFVNDESVSDILETLGAGNGLKIRYENNIYYIE